MRIKGVQISPDKGIGVGLTYIFGVGRKTSQKILENLKINPSTKVNDITKDQEDKIRVRVDELKVEGDLRLDVVQNIRRLKEIGCYRGERHSRNLPVRGQRTKTNARTKRGKKQTVGSGRKKSLEKT